jgi:hypothetical protein
MPSIPIRTERAMIRLACLCMLAATLSGCGVVRGMTVNTGEFFADHLPEWAGGLPADAPPRPGDPRYAKYIEEQNAKATQNKQLTPAADTQAVPPEGQAPR